MSAFALRLSGIEKTFRSGDTLVPVLKGVDLDLAEGEFSALMGPSGCGKSTLLMIAGMLEPPSTGAIELGGLPLSLADLSAAELRAIRRRGVGFVFQKPNLIPFLTASENIEVVLEINDMAPRKRRTLSRSVLAELDLAHRADQLPRRLSGGEQQRVAIGRALATRPALILADEPTAALDSVRGRQALELLRDAARRNGAAALVVTHDQRSLDLFDRVIQMEDGRIKG
ncbi:ABC transporter ATP-binding protein [Devosia sp. FKR38]|uniref:ABC transporter ATP-binding protein n=1 Tax=Devosia sp. FKR38 TaxID=2562312 RepID=UPI0010C082D4|nr:ABC transporter ATP-binding protein [Devosia sp. FKR38]